MTHSGLLQRGSVALSYESWGEGECLICVHGFGSDREALRALAEAVGKGFRVVLLDLRGHGASGSPAAGRDAAESDDAKSDAAKSDDGEAQDGAEDQAAYGYPVQRDDLLALLDALGVERAHWLGHSMGGQLALMAALRAPARARSLIAICAGPNRPIVEAREKRAWERAAARFEKMSQAEVAVALAAAAPRVQAENCNRRPEAALELYGRARGSELARIVRGAFLPMRGNAAACRELQVPALVIAGEQDAQWLEPSRQLAELLPRAELHTVPEAGHLVQLERPEMVAGWVSEFLRAQRLEA